MNVPLGDTYYLKFTTRQFSTGAPFTLAGTPVVSVYEEGNLTQITAGITLTADYDSVTGLNDVAIVATTGNGYEAGKYYSVVITTGTVDSVSVVGEVVGHFRIVAAENTAGLQAVDATQIEGSDATDQINAACDTALTDYDAVVPADLPTNFGDLAITATTGRVDVGEWLGNAVTASGGNPDVNIESIDDGAITAAKLAADCITAAKIATDAIGSDELASGAITEIWNHIVETNGSRTAQQVLSVALAVLAGETTSGGATFLDPSGTSTRVAATVNGSNERTAVTVTPSS